MLAFRFSTQCLINEPSRPARARGLKLAWASAIILPAIVAPRAGAWIETSSVTVPTLAERSRPARARGLKLHPAYAVPTLAGRAPRGRVA